MNDQQLGKSLHAQLMKAAIHYGAAGAAALTRHVFAARGGLARFAITSDLAYGSEPAQRLDVWCDKVPRQGLRPVVLLLHGGGFQHLDRTSHWSFAERFAQAGALVFNADYRLAPAHRYPAAADDAELAYRYTVERALALGGDPEQVIVAGVSAGANLALGLAITHAADAVPVRAAVLFSGLLQVSDMPRLYRARSHSRLMRARIASIGCDYPADDSTWTTPASADPRFDPLLHLERLQTLRSDFAATFISTGSADQVLEDSLRLRETLTRLQTRCLLDVVPSGGHGFQGMLHRPAVRALWEHCFAFLRAQGLPLRSAADWS